MRVSKFKTQIQILSLDAETRQMRGLADKTAPLSGAEALSYASSLKVSLLR